MAKSAATKLRESRMRRNILLSSCGGGAFRCFRRLRAMLLPPFAILLVAPEIFLDHGINDVVRAAFDEARVVLQQLLDGLFDFHLQRHDGWCFLNEWHGSSPLIDVLPDSFCAAEKAGTLHR